MTSPLEPRQPAEEKPYGLDDLVRHEKRQTWWTAALLIGAVVFTVGRQLWRDGPAEGVGPIGTSAGSAAPGSR